MEPSRNLRLALSLIEKNLFDPTKTSFALLRAITVFTVEGAQMVWGNLPHQKQQTLDDVLLKEGRTYDPSEVGSVPSQAQPFGAHAKRVVGHLLEQATSIASNLGHTTVGPEHVVLAMVHDGLDPAGQLLRDLGLDSQMLKTTLLQLRALSGVTSSESPPDLETLHLGVAVRHVDSTRLAVVADLDGVPPELVADFMGALDALHRAWGGAGLYLEGGVVGATSSVRERV